MLAAAVPPFDAWRYQFHLEVWVLGLFLIGAYVYLVRSVGPAAVKPGQQVVSRRNVWCFVGAMVLFWAASDWPIHDLGEEYLYSAHMLQHMMLTYFMPPLAILATPEWLFRLLIGNGRLYGAIRWLCKPVVAGFAFNSIVMITHVPGVVNASAENGTLHYSLHVLLVMLSLLMWMPIISPMKEFQIGYGGKMAYLFTSSIIPSVPAGWLTFGESAVYSHYDHPVRVFGLSVIDDQQIAGGIMKVGGSVFLWTIIIWMFFKRFARDFDRDQSLGRGHTPPKAEIVGHDDDTLTFEQVQRAFDASEPVRER